ncbi:AAA family ATPase [Actinoplanes sp. NPDC026619]|uniref:ATP-binding protein n=1 Tax=Actinoplanes sp. NPDC026619 TaxID=3155798 RepID=UPI0033C0C784
MDDGRIGKIRLVEPAESRVWIDFQDGKAGYIVTSQWQDYTVGDVYLLRDGADPERAPDALWGPAASVGVVRHVGADRATMDVDGALKSFPQRSPDPFEVGQSIEMDSAGRPGRLLSSTPIDRLGLADRSSFDIDSLVLEPAGTVSLQDFGGSAGIVSRARNLVMVALDPENKLKAMGVNPIKGMLFTGPPGTGKTHLAKALAAESGAKFYNVAGPAIVDQFVGQSERTLRALFDHALANAPAILFFDEIDSLFTQRGDASHDYNSRLVGQFLSLLDGHVTFERVMIIATTNLHHALDDALLRPGRLAHKIEFVLPGPADRKAVLDASSRAIKFSEPVDLAALAGRTDGWTSADLAAIWTEAGILAALDGRTTLSAEDVDEGMQRVQRIPARVEKGTSA